MTKAKFRTLIAGNKGLGQLTKIQADKDLQRPAVFDRGELDNVIDDSKVLLGQFL